MSTNAWRAAGAAAALAGGAEVVRLQALSRDFPSAD